jgi:glycosyltransferase involved in cell wall biosynthesis
VRELGLALGRWHPELESWFVLNRDLPVPALMTEAFTRYGRVVYSDDTDLPRDAIYHSPSPFEPSPIDRLWPPSLRRLPLVVTLHDWIPAVFPDENMPDAGVRRFYWARAEIIRQAERALSVSQATADDAVNLFGLRPDRLSITGGGVSESFRPPASRSAVRATLGLVRPAIGTEYMLYTGGMDYRKNVDGLLTAYARLPRSLRDRYKLVLVGRLGLDDPRGPFAAHAAALGIPDRVVFTGFVSDEELVLLYQGASLFVFPSLYEGFGLPVVEALACGAPAIVGRNSSLIELVDQEEALFDTADPASIQAALTRALTDGELLERLRRPDIRERFAWRRIADRTAETYDEVASRRRPVRRRRRILCVAPLPAVGADGETTRRVLEALADRCDIDLLVDGDVEQPPTGVEPVSPRGLDRVERLRCGYDGKVYWLGNSLEYALPLHMLRGRRGVVIAYNVRLTSLYASASAARPDLEPRKLVDVLHSMYGDRVPAKLDSTGVQDDAVADRYGVYMAKEAIAHSTTFFVHLPAALAIARLDAHAGHEQRISQLPLPLPTVGPALGHGSRMRIAVFTGTGRSSAAEKVVRQLEELAADVTIVGEARPLTSAHTAAIAVRGAQDAAGFTSFLAYSLAAGLPLLLCGLSLGDLRPKGAVELDSEMTDTELSEALKGLSRGAEPVDQAAAAASVEAVAARIHAAMNTPSL